MKKNLRKAISLFLSAAVVGSTVLTGGIASAEDAGNLLDNTKVTGSGEYIQTFLKSDYYSAGATGFELTFQYDELGDLAADNTVGFNDTFEFVVFDTEWGGWNTTMVGPDGADQSGNLTAADIKVGQDYTVTVPIDVIEAKLNTGKAAQGINIQTGGIGNTKVTIVSLKYVTGSVESQPTILTGSWHKTGIDGDETYGSMSLESGFADVYANPWNISVSNFSVATFKNPVVAVTVEYGEIENGPIYPQSEIVDATTYQPVVPNYPQVSEAGTVTYLTNIPKDMTSMLVCYDTCTVTKVEIYDEAESYTKAKTGLTNETITEALGTAWNLGNALDSTAEKKTDETLWGNPEINKRLFKQVAEAGFKTVRIPVTWLSAVKVDGNNATIDKTEFNRILNRVQEVVDMAIDYDLFVVINIQHDGADSVDGSWLDVDAENQTGIRAAFENIWEEIADKFIDYDQHLIFESMNEVMEENNYSVPSKNTWDNINKLNDLFVEVVRDASGYNTTRFLIIPGYNTNIDQTVSDSFVIPTPSTNIIVSVHFYDPYQFTIGEGQTTVTDADLQRIADQFALLKAKFVDKGIPVFVGEVGAMDKGNLDQVAKYMTKVKTEADKNGLTIAVWDNGYTGENGMGLWNRWTYAESELGKVVIPILVP